MVVEIFSSKRKLALLKILADYEPDWKWQFFSLDKVEY